MSAEVAPVQIVAKGDLLAASGGSPVLRAEAPQLLRGPVLWHEEAAAWAVAFLRPTHVHGVNVMLHAGDRDQRTELMPASALAALDSLVRSAPFARWLAQTREDGATHVSLPRAGVPLVGDLLADPEHAVGRWEWMWTRTPPPAPGMRVVHLDRSARGELDDLLARDNARTDGRPFAHDAQRWVGVRDGGGRLVAVGCCELEVSGAPILAGITTASGFRGRGLGRAVTAELTRGAIAEHGWCTLGMYSDNPIARGLYTDLGYTIAAEWTSGALA